MKHYQHPLGSYEYVTLYFRWLRGFLVHSFPPQMLLVYVGNTLLGRTTDPKLLNKSKFVSLHSVCNPVSQVKHWNNSQTIALHIAMLVFV